MAADRALYPGQGGRQKRGRLTYIATHRGLETLSEPFSPRHGPPPASRAGRAEGHPDPWGVRRAENLLTSLEGILSARVVTTPLGEVSKGHILAQAGLAPKQLVRNIESALLAQLGLKIDHRKISIAQTADVKPIEAMEREAVREVLQRAVCSRR